LYHVHLHAFGFLYCAITHSGLLLHPPPRHTFVDSLIHWPLMLFVTPLLFVVGADTALRDQRAPSADSIGSALSSVYSSIASETLPLAADEPPPNSAAEQASTALVVCELRSASLHNVFCYFVPFWVGTLPNFCAKAGLLPDFSLSARSVATWGISQIIEVGVAGTMLCHLLGYHCWRAARAKLLRRVLVFYCTVILLLSGTVLALRGSHDAHLHHYFTAALVVPLTRYRGAVPAVWQGLLVGFQLQGVAVFGIEPLFYPALAKLT